MNQEVPIFRNVLQAYQRIRNQVHRTPVMTSSAINTISGAKLVFKCENFQKVGAFKFRGASNAVLSLSSDELSKGVITHSSGNHAAALALAAQLKNIPAYIIMPENSPEIKKRAVESYGAQITYCPPGLENRELYTQQVIAKTGATFIHPYDNAAVIAGQGTAAYELLCDEMELDILVVPVGGGGLLSGSLLSARAMNENIRVIAAEPLGADDAWKSFYSGRLHPSNNPNTIADGLLTSLGQLNYQIIVKHLDEVMRVSDEQIKYAMQLFWERMKIVIEPSGAIGLAAVLSFPEYFAGKRVGVILSGGNREFN
jgi:threonine dehydratase